jgi:hypothetical protein
VGGQQVRAHQLNDVLSIVHFFIAKPKYPKAARNGGFRFQPVLRLHIRLIVNGAIEFNEEAV